MIKLTIIIPYKNSDKSIIKTLRSIKSQKVNDNCYEVLLINDFSNNKTTQIIKKYIHNFHNFKLFKSKKKTYGPGHARNLAIDLSKGKYILFLDSDDCLKKKSLKKIIHITNNNQGDIYAFNFKVFDKIKNMKRKKRHDLDLLKLKKKDIFEKYLETSIIPQVISNLFSKKFLMKNKIKFKDGYFEDILFFLKSIYYAKSITINKDIFYLKYNRKNSIVNSLSEKHIFYHFRAYTECYRFLKNKYPIKIKYFYLKGIIGLTAVYINKIIASNIIQSKKNKFLNNLYKIFSKILLASNLKYVYKSDKDKLVKNFFKLK